MALILAASSDLWWRAVQVARCEGVSEVHCKAQFGTHRRSASWLCARPWGDHTETKTAPHTALGQVPGGAVGEAC